MNERDESREDVHLPQPDLHDVGVNRAHDSDQLPDKTWIVRAARAHLVNRRLGREQPRPVRAAGNDGDMDLFTPSLELRSEISE